MPGQTTETIEFILPKRLGLTEEQTKELEARFTKQLVEVLQDTHAEAMARAKAQEKSKAKAKQKVEIEVLVQPI
jgi:hypothetical protein